MLYNTVGGVRGAFKKRAVLLAWVLENCESVYRKLFSEDVWGSRQWTRMLPGTQNKNKITWNWCFVNEYFWMLGGETVYRKLFY